MQEMCKLIVGKVESEAELLIGFAYLLSQCFGNISRNTLRIEL